MTRGDGPHLFPPGQDRGTPGSGSGTGEPPPVLPDYGGPCIANLVPALLAPTPPPPWLPEPARAEQVVLLVVDGLGWVQLQEHKATVPTLAAAQAVRLSSVVPSTTATALTSLTTGLPPARHGILGYRVRNGDDGVLNVLQWTVRGRDMRRELPSGAVQPLPPFLGRRVPVVTRTEFQLTGFSALHLGSCPQFGWRVPSTLVERCVQLVATGEPFVYAYYDGIDKVSHEWGLGAEYRAELAAIDRLVGDLAARLPAHAALVIVADHGQVSVEGPGLVPDSSVMSLTSLVSGEGRFRWLHARPGKAADLAKVAADAFSEVAWVRTRDEIVEQGWFGGVPGEQALARLGDVALVAREPVAFLDPADIGESRLVGRHGSLTAAEMDVPLLVLRGQADSGDSCA